MKRKVSFRNKLHRISELGRYWEGEGEMFKLMFTFFTPEGRIYGE